MNISNHPPSASNITIRFRGRFQFNKMNRYLIILCLGIWGCEMEQTPNVDLIISNVNLIDGTGAELQKNVNIYIKNGLIQKIDREKVYQKEQVIDGTDKYLIPGLFDGHVHTSNYKKGFSEIYSILG